ncbi:hypothetical protein C8R44DRAFT_814712 [Mycena epipterygia]|nr:hypothetical protein C8R44DRAFT_814712 [Mycena epipterygia]
MLTGCFVAWLSSWDVTLVDDRPAIFNVECRVRSSFSLLLSLLSSFHPIRLANASPNARTVTPTHNRMGRSPPRALSCVPCVPGWTRRRPTKRPPPALPVRDTVLSAGQRVAENQLWQETCWIGIAQYKCAFFPAVCYSRHDIYDSCSVIALMNYDHRPCLHLSPSPSFLPTPTNPSKSSSPMLSNLNNRFALLAESQSGTSHRKTLADAASPTDPTIMRIRQDIETHYRSRGTRTTSRSGTRCACKTKPGG